MEMEIINIPEKQWTLLANASVSFQVLHDNWIYWKQTEETPTGIPATAEPAYKALNGNIYNHYSNDGQLWGYALTPCEVVIGDFQTLQFLKSDQTTIPIEHFLTSEVQAVTLQQNVALGANTVILDAFTVAPITGNDKYYLEIRYNDTVNNFVRFFQSEVQTITDNSPANVTIQVAMPFDFDCDTTYIETTFITDGNMIRVSAGATPATGSKKVFTTPPDGIKWHVTKMTISAIMDGAPDDAKFFGGEALTWGLFGGVVTNDDTVHLHLVNIKTNGCFRATSNQVVYTTRTLPTSQYGFFMEKKFSSDNDYGVAFQLRGDKESRLLIAMQESLSDKATCAQSKIFGHVVD